MLEKNYIPQRKNYPEYAYSKEKLADELSDAIVVSKLQRKNAINKLREIVGMKPKRPMFYLNHELVDLPRWTRGAVKYLGDYMDHLVKFFSSQNLNNSKYESKSLGYNINSIKNIIPPELSNNILIYNQEFYVPAKHDFKVIGRRHRFTCKEVVYCCFITIKIGKELIKLSDHAKKWAEDKIY